MTPNDDPGWPHGPSMFVFLIPGAVPWYLRRRGTGDGLLVLRQVFISFPVALVLVGIALAPIRLQGGSLVPWLPILIALAIVSLVGERVIEKPLDCATDATLAGTYSHPLLPADRVRRCRRALRFLLRLYRRSEVDLLRRGG